MLIAGEKWACEACVRGHRVSNCQHSDRPLQHINKKGRPVSQCQHCRTLRKSRSAHVRCDCSSEKIQNKEASSIEGVAQGSCSCCHGRRCTCALKKEPLDPVPESDSDGPLNVDKRRARTHTKSPENNLTIFTNGYHKPPHKHNNTAQKYGSPYPTPRSQSLHGPSPSSLISQSEKYPGYLPKIGCSNPIIKETSIGTPGKQNLPVSICNLSDSNPTNREYIGTQLQMVNLYTSGEMDWPQSVESVSSSLDTDNNLYSVGINSASIDWSHYEGLKFNNEKFVGKPFSQPSSFTGFDFVGLDQPPLTPPPTSGDLSEIDELGPFSDRSSGESIFHHQKTGSDKEASEFCRDVEGYRSSATSSFMHLPQLQVQTNNIHLDDLDAFLKYSYQLNNQPHCISLSTNENKNSKQELSPFQDENFGIFSADDEHETFWLSNFSPNRISSGTSSNQNGLLDSFWVQ
ncbi:putative copper fist dna binding domain protein [Erysiphe necator]|uniref:Putative copper fist dna binding domain protein n=1 Tax=Uncinula necator TaxID=52586 RepID=A0A0B1P3R1_UNCNE|nr:putative copper fist dna binding domain protein [Erysiphe necator]